MAAKKTSKPKPAKRPSKLKQQVDDPIIIKGGSVSINFEGGAKFIKDNSNPQKNKFDHGNGSKRLTQLVALRRNNATGEYEPIPGPFPNGRIPLERDDWVVICYTGSLCY
jgi:hypothetical protein